MLGGEACVTLCRVIMAEPVFPSPPEIAPEVEQDDTAAVSVSMFRALRHRNFRLYFFGQATSLIGTWMQSAAQAWLILKLTNSSMMLGVVSFANYLPVLLMTTFAGVVVDRVDRRRLITATQILLMLSAMVLAALTWLGVVRPIHVIALAAFNGIVSSFDMPGRQAFVVKMVNLEDLSNAIALNSLIVNGARVVGPAVAGLLIAAVGTATCFFLNGLSYLAVIWSLLAMTLAAEEIHAKHTSMLERLREGFSYVRHHKPTLYLLLLSAVANGIASQYAVLVPIFAHNILHGEARDYGFLMAAQGMGAMVGAFILATRVGDARELSWMLGLGLLLMAVATSIFSLSPWLGLSLAAQALTGMGLIGSRTTTNTLLQISVPDELRGRVMSFFTLSAIGMLPFGALGVGFAGEHLSPQLAVQLCAIVGLLCGAVVLVRLKIIAGGEGPAQP
jgi:MFS family permease